MGQGSGALPEMNERMRARMQSGAQSFMEPGETVKYGVANMTMPVWVYFPFAGILLAPYVIQKSSFAVVTDRNVYVFKSTGIGFKPRRVLFKAPLGSATASVEGSAFPGRHLLIADQKLWLAFARRFQLVAAAMADMVNNGPSGTGSDLDDAAAKSVPASPEQAPHSDEPPSAGR